MNDQDEFILSINDHNNNELKEDDCDNYNNDQDYHFTSILNRYQDSAKNDPDIVSLVQLLYDHIDESPQTFSEDTLLQFRHLVKKLVPGRTTDIVFEVFNCMRMKQEYDQSWPHKLSTNERNLVCGILINVMTLLYEKDISVDFKLQIKSSVLMYSVFINPSSECTLL